MQRLKVNAMLKGRRQHKGAALREDKPRQRGKGARKPPSACPRPEGVGGEDESGKALKGAAQGHLVPEPRLGQGAIGCRGG